MLAKKPKKQKTKSPQISTFHFPEQNSIQYFKKFFKKRKQKSKVLPIFSHFLINKNN